MKPILVCLLLAACLACTESDPSSAKKGRWKTIADKIRFGRSFSGKKSNSQASTPVPSLASTPVSSQASVDTSTPPPTPPFTPTSTPPPTPSPTPPPSPPAFADPANLLATADGFPDDGRTFAAVLVEAGFSVRWAKAPLELKPDGRTSFDQVNNLRYAYEAISDTTVDILPSVQMDPKKHDSPALRVAYRSHFASAGNLKEIRLTMAFHLPEHLPPVEHERQMADVYLSTLRESQKLVLQTGPAALTLRPLLFVDTKTLAVDGIVQLQQAECSPFHGEILVRSLANENIESQWAETTETIQPESVVKFEPVNHMRYAYLATTREGTDASHTKMLFKKLRVKEKSPGRLDSGAIRLFYQCDLSWVGKRVKTMRVVAAFHLSAQVESELQEQQIAEAYLASVKDSLRSAKHTGRASVQLTYYPYASSNTMAVVGLVTLHAK